MGGGKTHQAIALILREHMPGVFMKEYAGGRVEIVAHRVSLREYLYGLLKDHDFELYSLIEDWDNVKKLIICIDSLWKVTPSIKSDLVWIDEVHEMIGLKSWVGPILSTKGRGEQGGWEPPYQEGGWDPPS